MSTASIRPPQLVPPRRHRVVVMSNPEFLSLLRYLQSCRQRTDVLEFDTEIAASRFMLRLADRIGAYNMFYVQIQRRFTTVSMYLRGMPSGT